MDTKSEVRLGYFARNPQAPGSDCYVNYLFVSSESVRGMNINSYISFENGDIPPGVTAEITIFV